MSFLMNLFLLVLIQKQAYYPQKTWRVIYFIKANINE